MPLNKENLTFQFIKRFCYSYKQVYRKDIRAEEGISTSNVRYLHLGRKVPQAIRLKHNKNKNNNNKEDT